MAARCKVCGQPMPGRLPGQRGRPPVTCSEGCHKVERRAYSLGRYHAQRAKAKAAAIPANRDRTAATVVPAHSLVVAKSIPVDETQIGANYTAEQEAWLAAVAIWRQQRRGRLPTACDFLAIARAMGYRKVATPEVAT